MEGKKGGLHKCFIFREKKLHTFYLHQGLEFNDPKNKFLLMARYMPKQQEFRIYTVNAYKLPELLTDPDSHIAVVKHHK